MSFSTSNAWDSFGRSIERSMNKFAIRLERDFASVMPIDENHLFWGSPRGNRAAFASDDNHGVFFSVYSPTLSSTAESSSGWMTPTINVYENDKHWTIYVEIPGVKKEDIKVDVKKDLITISGEAKFDKEYTNSGNVRYLHECYQGTFKRSLTLPDDIDHDKISAKFENGILHVNLPKAPETKPSRKVSI
ncbi:HSP20-like chaperone, partial [Phascolomyces articulosus]